MTRILVRDWRAMKRLFLGKHPFVTQCLEVSTTSQASGHGAIVTLAKRGGWPKDEVAAFFVLAGAWRRHACAGWFQHDGAPAKLAPLQLDGAWRSLRDMVERGDFGLGRADPEAMDAAIRLALDRLLLGKRVGPDVDASSASAYDAELSAQELARGTKLIVDGVPSSVPVTVRPRIDRPWVRCTVLSDRWNDLWTLGETRAGWALVHWSTSA